ncbi:MULTISPECIES: hypothetical protein [unclassified Pseudomonas]|uniref:hypothetical protein n=1 Tax=unclassified Pseudomonas TaxID=196821 RepID=UPI001068D237|nr:hypothetical protein [Pseudomonas sp. SXM-1]QBQ10436.1 hypothetical protein DCC84_12155 [Pseudomonas sp. SXM-1]
MESVVMRNRPLADVFARAASSELDILADIITDKGDGRLALSTKSKDAILKNKKLGKLQSIGGLLAQEICCYGGHTLVNMFRSNGAEYREVAKDVGIHLGAKIRKNDDVYAVEEKVVEHIIQTFAKSPGKNFTNEDRSNLLAFIVRGLVYSDQSALERFLKEHFLGGGFAPIFKIVFLPTYLANEITGLTSQLRITVPAVIQIASMRRRQVDAEYHYYRRSLEACL